MKNKHTFCPYRGKICNFMSPLVKIFHFFPNSIWVSACSNLFRKISKFSLIFETRNSKPKNTEIFETFETRNEISQFPDAHIYRFSLNFAFSLNFTFTNLILPHLFPCKYPGPYINFSTFYIHLS
jgi:hypothetical protein